MAKKRQSPKKRSNEPSKKKATKRPSRPKRSADSPPALPDRRALEGIMRSLMGGLMGASEETPLGQAQEFLDRAFDEPDPRSRAKLAKQALAVSPDCADAYVLLAEQADGRKEALATVRAGRRRRGAGDRPRRLPGGRGPLLGPAGDPPLHACPRGPGPHPLDPGTAGGGGRAPAGDAPAQPQRQPGPSLHPGRLAPEPGPGRRAGRAPGAV